MDPIITNWLLLAGIHGVAVMSPGPDFVMAVQNSISYSRRAGIMTAIGFALGISVHVTYTLAGLATIITESIFLFNLIKYAGAGYLIYMGAKSLMSSGFNSSESKQAALPKTMTNFQALRSGFLTNLLNPKVTIFFLAVFSQFMGPQTPLWVQISYAATCVIQTALWFSIVALLMSQNKVRSRFLSFSKWIDRICGGLLIALGLKLALSKVST